jgi:methylated-DNA-[protein]-cysteine S-methyltransferase
MDMKIRHSILRTKFGRLVVLWMFRNNKVVIIRILLSTPAQSAELRLDILFPDSIPETCPEIDAISNRLLGFLMGMPVSFSLDEVQMDVCSDFQQAVLVAEFGIPRGAVSTYRRIGQYLGMPDAARAVGNALANNPFPIVIPCHRAIRSDCTLGGFQGGMEMKQSLLEMEGHCFDGHGRIDKPKFHY